eukprot:11158806-Lingulodinium_polyedra.AAC.1
MPLAVVATAPVYPTRAACCQPHPPRAPLAPFAVPRMAPVARGDQPTRHMVLALPNVVCWTRAVQ